MLKVTQLVPYNIHLLQHNHFSGCVWTLTGPVLLELSFGFSNISKLCRCFSFPLFNSSTVSFISFHRSTIDWLHDNVCCTIFSCWEIHGTAFMNQSEHTHRYILDHGLFWSASEITRKLRTSNSPILSVWLFQASSYTCVVTKLINMVFIFFG